MKGGAVEFLTKPVRDQDLLDAIQLAIAQDRARRDNERAVANPSWLLRHADAA
jgi:FixJ family two-component response regulator